MGQCMAAFNKTCREGSGPLLGFARVGRVNAGREHKPRVGQQRLAAQRRVKPHVCQLAAGRHGTRTATVSVRLDRSNLAKPGCDRQLSKTKRARRKGSGDGPSGDKGPVPVSTRQSAGVKATRTTKCLAGSLGTRAVHKKVDAAQRRQPPPPVLAPAKHAQGGNETSARRARIF